MILLDLDELAARLKRGENVQNRQLQTWLTKDEYAQIEAEWQEQLGLREELKDKPSGDFRKLLQERIDKANPCRTELTKEEQKRLGKLSNSLRPC